MEHHRGVGIEGLSKGELEVLIFLSKGCTDKEIARLRGTTRVTVGSQVRVLLIKLDAGRRIEAAVLAAKAGLV